MAAAPPPKKAKKAEKVCCGVGVLVVSGGGDKVLLGRRKGAHGAGTWALPGGWLEKGESFEACALRELEEETGLVDVAGPPAAAPFVSNNVARMDGVHSVTVFVRVDVAGEPDAEVREPHKCHEWAWHAIGDALPEPVFPPLASLAASPYWASLTPAP
jgi:ADP-ribose pyrophosphatase YjhB (NUDIX family)